MQSLENIEAELECRLYGVCSADEVKMLLPEIAEKLEAVGGQFNGEVMTLKGLQNTKRISIKVKLYTCKYMGAAQVYVMSVEQATNFTVTCKCGKDFRTTKQSGNLACPECRKKIAKRLGTNHTGDPKPTGDTFELKDLKEMGRAKYSRSSKQNS